MICGKTCKKGGGGFPVTFWKGFVACALFITIAYHLYFSSAAVISHHHVRLQSSFDNSKLSKPSDLNIQSITSNATTDVAFTSSHNTSTNGGNILLQYYNDEGMNTSREPLVLDSAVDDDTTIIVTSNLIPSHPRIRMINETIQSLFQNAIGLHESSHIIITIDILPMVHSEDDKQRYNQYIANLKLEFTNPTSRRRVTILPLTHDQKNITQNEQKRYRGLSWNLFHALELVQTPFVYVIQHDMPFRKKFNHSGIIKTMKEYPNDLRLVRFSRQRNGQDVGANKAGTCWNASSPVNFINGIQFIKTPGWSDNNQIGQKAYYDEIFERFIVPARRHITMEFVMRAVAIIENCSQWGPFLYSQSNTDGWYIGHLDGRLTPEYRRMI